MPNPIKYSTSSETLALKKGNFYIGTGDVGKGPSDTTGYYNGVSPSSGGYVIYMNKTGAPGNLSYHNAPTDEALISFTNNLAGQSYTGVNQCLVYYAGQTDKVCVNRDYENIVTNGLVLNLDAGFTPSYPTSGITWYDVAGSNNGTLTNGPTFNSANSGSIVLDGVDDYVNLDGIQNNITTKATISIIMSISTLTRFQRIIGGGNRTTIAGFNDTKIINWNLYINNKGYINRYSNTILQLNQIYYVTGTVDLTENIYKLYINGVEESGSGTGEIPTGSDFLDYSNMFRINSGGGNVGQSYGGNVYVAQVYNRALSSSEVLQNYNAMKSRFGL